MIYRTDAPIIARKLLPAMRDLLLAHLDDKAVPIDRSRHRVLHGLLNHGLVCYPPKPGSPRPSTTRITEFGREVLSYVLADAIEVLVTAGYMEAIDDPLTQTRETCTRRRPAPCPISAPLSAAAAPTAP